MKKITYFLLTLVALIGFSSCEHDDDVVFTAGPEINGIEFQNAPASNYVLTAATSGNVGERFVWNEADFDAETNINYDLQGSASEDFSSYSVIASQVSETNAIATVGQMLDLAEEAGLDNDPETEAPNNGSIYFRVVAYPGTNPNSTLAVTSNKMALSVVLPESGEAEEILKNLYLVGNATAADWNNNNNNTPLFRDPENPDLYHFQGKFIGGEFKLLEERGLWQPQWGTNDGSTLAVNPGDTEDPGSFVVDAEGYYSYTFNLSDMTFSKESVDASGAATYASIGFLGDATADGWDADTDMTQSTFNPHIWYAKDVELADGEMKFRANDAWDVNWGAGTAVSGKATINGPNIPVTEGTYEIWFNDLDGRYILIPTGEE